SPEAAVPGSAGEWIAGPIDFRAQDDRPVPEKLAFMTTQPIPFFHGAIYPAGELLPNGSSQPLGTAEVEKHGGSSGTNFERAGLRGRGADSDSFQFGIQLFTRAVCDLARGHFGKAPQLIGGSVDFKLWHTPPLEQPIADRFPAGERRYHRVALRGFPERR